MKLLNRLTLKHLFMNKKRTIVTIIGITLSTALMVGIGLLVSTFLNAMREDAIKYSGSYHAYFDSLTKLQQEELSLNVNFSKTYSYGVLGFANVASVNEYKPYLYVVSANNLYFEQEELIEGRFAFNDSEIVLSNHFLSNGGADYKIGDEIQLNIGYRKLDDDVIYSNNISYGMAYDEGKLVPIETIVPVISKTYKIVGIVSRSKMEDYSAPGYMAFTTNAKDIQEYRLYAEYKNVKKAYDLTEDICSKLEEGNITCNTNNSLLYYYGVSRYDNINKSIVSVLVVALCLLSVGCIIVIYNSFAISSMERKKTFGLLSSLGATPKQIKYTVFFEAFLVGFCGIVLGIIGAFLGIYIVVQILNYLVSDVMGMSLVFTVEPLYVFIPILFMILVVYFSAFLPAKRSSKISSIEMIRENDEIKIPRRKVKTPRWIRKIFGMEGEIALKNMKRNKRKYRITLLSIFVSIVLFISFSTYLKLGLSITDMSELPDFDILVNTSDSDTVREILSESMIDKYYMIRHQSFQYTALDASYYHKNYYDYLNYQSDVPVIVNLSVLEDKDFEELTSFTKTSFKKALFLNQMQYTVYSENSRRTYQTPIFVKNVNSLNLCTVESESQNCDDFEISIVNEIPEMISSLDISTEVPNIILSESMVKDKTNIFDDPYYGISIYSSDYKRLYEHLSKKYEKNDTTIVSPKMIMEQEKNSILAIKILLYGFISLVTLIGVTSVFNTMYTSIYLRRKEFAMLRSVGLSFCGFNRMILFESFFFGLKSLFYALPVSFAFVYLINLSIGDVFSFGKIVIPWNSIFIAIFAVFFILLLTIFYSVRKIKKENILNSLRDENI